ELLANLATEVVFSETLSARRAMTDDALAIARRVDDPATLAHVLISRCVALWHPSTLAERLAHGAELAGLVEALGDPHLAYFTTWYRYAALVEAGRIPEADRELALAGELAASLGETMPTWVQSFTQAGRAALGGDLEAAERLAEEELTLGTRIGQ